MMKPKKLFVLISLVFCVLLVLFKRQGSRYPHFSDVVEEPLEDLYITISGDGEDTHWYINYIEVNSEEKSPLEEDIEISPFIDKDLKHFEKQKLDSLYVYWDKGVKWNSVKEVMNHLPKGKVLYLSYCPDIDLSFLRSDTSYSEIHFSNGIDVASFQPNDSISNLSFAICFNIPWDKVLACSSLDTVSYHTGEILPSSVLKSMSESSVSCLWYYHPYDLWDQTDLADRLNNSLYPPYLVQSASEVPKWLYDYWNNDDLTAFFSRDDRIIELLWLMND